HHTDGGVQYTSAAYRQVLDSHHIAQSVGRPGTCWDNAVAESFFATLKNELVYRHTWTTHRQPRQAIFEFIVGWYNQHRRHSALGHRSPPAVEQRTIATSLAA